ncbi:MAG TPA: UDP-N-acetylmuramoyl-tripeptide--D-alanyl-D-alanine ligase [Thermoanaerobaculia bacterium]|nr:UDP-N-acetylmuramoyl-tripeptide--D-alanyl-D-alanine ligase [Thermoanaerobaculia bacterium]
MARLSVDEAARAVGGRVTAGDPGAMIDGAAIDSRAIRGGELFFAFAGAHTDGHRFVPDALARGATAAMVQEDLPAPPAGALIRVPDTFKALHDLARHVRAQVPERLVGITGSAGKTTTKELLAAMLARRFRVSWTPGNLNNLYGFPLSLLNVPDGTQWMVAEMGMSTPGELQQLSLLGRPDAALFTVVRPVHLEFFDSVQAIAEAKSELLAGLARDGFIVANADDPEVARIASRHGARVVWYALRSEEADVKALNLASEPEGGVGSRFVLQAGGHAVEVHLPLHGLYNVENCLAASACAWALGLPLEEIAEAVRGVKPAAMRGVVHRAAGGFTLIDDSYNSNPDALGKALEGAALLPGERRVAVLGDMRELGPAGPRFHREAGERAARLGFSPVVGVGELSRELARAAEAAGAAAIWVPDAAAAADWVTGEVRPGDLVLVKASRGIGLEKVVQRLLGQSAGETGH